MAGKQYVVKVSYALTVSLVGAKVVQSRTSYLVVERHAAVPWIPCHVDVLSFRVDILFCRWYMGEKRAERVSGLVVPRPRQVLKKWGVSHKIFIIVKGLAVSKDELGYVLHPVGTAFRVAHLHEVTLISNEVKPLSK